MQYIWDKQNQASLYAINEAALHKRIQDKGNKINWTLNFFEYSLVATNIAVGISFIVDALKDDKAWYYIAVASILFVVAGYTLKLRLLRQKRNTHFAPTMLGELDKAITQASFLIERIEAIFWWYILPVFSVVVATIYFDANPNYGWWIAGVVVVGVAAWWASRWEVRCWHLPKKRDLESLRDLLTQSQ